MEIAYRIVALSYSIFKTIFRTVSHSLISVQKGRALARVRFLCSRCDKVHVNFLFGWAFFRFLAAKFFRHSDDDVPCF